MSRVLLLQGLVLAAASRGCVEECQTPPSEDSLMHTAMKIKTDFWDRCEMDGSCTPNFLANVTTNAPATCEGGSANGFDCEKIDMLAFVSIEDMGFTERISDIWGWEDLQENREWAIGCGWQNTSFIDVTQPEEPLVVAVLKSPTDIGSRWCDAKTYLDHVFVVRDSNSGHGVQVFDLKRLRALRDIRLSTGEVQAVDMDTHYTEHGSSHNIAINEATGFAYSIGSNTCRGGLHQIDLRDPQKPVFAGCYDLDGYTHDAECVIYNGPHTRYVGREICFGYNEDSLTITDNTDHSNIVMLSRTEYEGSQYTHQGWLTADQGYLLLNDELDELYTASLQGRTTTHIWDVVDLENPSKIGEYRSTEVSIDHNNYIWPTQPRLAYQSNYCAGLRILDVTTIASGEVEQVAYFDLEPDCDQELEFQGSWSNYLFSSGVVVASNIYKGMFVLRVDADQVRVA